jgi:hypothetical protein
MKAARPRNLLFSPRALLLSRRADPCPVARSRTLTFGLARTVPSLRDGTVRATVPSPRAYSTPCIEYGAGPQGAGKRYVRGAGRGGPVRLGREMWVGPETSRAVPTAAVTAATAPRRSVLCALPCAPRRADTADPFAQRNKRRSRHWPGS